MYLTSLLALIVEATRRTFGEDYPVEQFRRLWVSLDYPVDRASYPGIWVDFQPTTDIQSAGIGHVEYGPPAADGSRRAATRWRYAGMVQLTCVALSGLERALLVDELVKVVAFGLENPARAEFTRMVEHNDLIAAQLQRDKIDVSAKAESPGTPWETDEVVYEQTVTVDCVGEFVSDGTDATLVRLSEVVVYEVAPGQSPPSGGGWV